MSLIPRGSSEFLFTVQSDGLVEASHWSRRWWNSRKALNLWLGFGRPDGSQLKKPHLVCFFGVESG